MRVIKNIYLPVFILGCLVFSACTKHLERMNENPNGADPETTNPNLVLSTVLTEAGRAFINLGFGDVSGVMQYTQKDGHPGAHNSYDWGGDNSWSNYYGILRNNQFVYEKAVEANDELSQGVTLVMKSMLFGLLTDLYGDVPYESSLQGDKVGTSNTFPDYASQQSVYEGILSDLDKANTLLSKSRAEYTNDLKTADVYYSGDPGKWRKLANSLALRYYMRVSDKLTGVAQSGIANIVNNPSQYPIITLPADDANMSFPGNGQSDSWPTNVVYDTKDSENYRITKMAQPFVDSLVKYGDPRIGVWANKVKIFLHLDLSFPPGTDYVKDTVVDGENRQVRYISADILSSRGITVNDIDQHVDYVGLPISLTGPQAYNLSTDLNQASRNPHVSWLNNIYQDPTGPLLKVRLMTATEVQFILAEAAQKGWIPASEEDLYYGAIKSSFDVWGLSSAYADYITHPDVEYDGSQKQLIVQKWIANWSSATEAWFDFRRTGYPELHGVAGHTIAPELPVRFYYPKDEQRLNKTNQEAAAGSLETTQYSGFGANGAQNSPWSKPWVVQGTGKPWQ